MAYKTRKRKVKKNVPEGIANIHSTFNNTITTITDNDGNVISWSSAGAIGYKGSKKSTPFAAGGAAEELVYKAVLRNPFSQHQGCLSEIHGLV